MTRWHQFAPCFIRPNRTAVIYAGVLRRKCPILCAHLFLTDCRTTSKTTDRTGSSGGAGRFVTAKPLPPFTLSYNQSENRPFFKPCFSKCAQFLGRYQVLRIFYTQETNAGSHLVTISVRAEVMMLCIPDNQHAKSTPRCRTDALFYARN